MATLLEKATTTMASTDLRLIMDDITNIAKMLTDPGIEHFIEHSR